MIKKLISWFSVFVWMGLIFWLSDQSKVIPSGNFLVTRVLSILGHIFVFGVLFLLVYIAMAGSLRVSKKRYITAGLFIVFIYGIIDEYHQSFIPHRDASLVDVGWDLLGGALANMLRRSKINFTRLTSNI